MVNTNFKIRSKTDKKTGLTKQQEFQIGQVMEKVLTETSKGWVYNENWSDQAIATACGSIARDLSEWQVARIRKQLFGELASQVHGGMFFNPMQMAAMHIPAMAQHPLPGADGASSSQAAGQVAAMGLAGSERGCSAAGREAAPAPAPRLLAAATRT